MAVVGSVADREVALKASWPPFSLPDIRNPLNVINAAGGCQYLAVKISVNAEAVSA
jgi:hypothetical protein